jgi:KDO2-lipid IV(A) lauroyltransferase
MALALESNVRQSGTRARRAFVNFSQYLVDLLRMEDLRREDFEPRVEMEGWEHFEAAYRRGKGVILVTMHMGHWDLAGAAIALRGYPVTAIVEDIAPPRLNAIVQDARRALGIEVIAATSLSRDLAAAARVLRVLRRGQVLALMVDEPEKERQLAVRFLGVETMVPAGPAALALATGAPIVPGVLVRASKRRYKGLIGSPIEPGSNGNREEALQVLSQRVVGAFEPWVRCYADQWFVFRPR